MGSINTLRAIDRSQKNFLESEINNNMTEARRIIMGSARRVYGHDKDSFGLIETVVKEYEHCLKSLLGLEVV